MCVASSVADSGTSMMVVKIGVCNIRAFIKAIELQNEVKKVI
jgi:hypothetical protein